MPDWSYRTLFRPLLFRLSAEKARDLTLSVFGALGKLPGGSFLIRTMGHMESSPLLESWLRQAELPFPVGLSGSVDSCARAADALSQIGFGFIEVGPVTPEAQPYVDPLRRVETQEAIHNADPYANAGIDPVLAGLRTYRGRAPLMFRLRPSPGSWPEEACRQVVGMAEAASGTASGFYLDWLDDRWSQQETAEGLTVLLKELRSRREEAPLLLYVPLDTPASRVGELLQAVPAELLDGVVLGEHYRTEEGYTMSPEGKGRSIAKLRELRPYLPEHFATIASGGVHEPKDALELLQAGARYVQLNSGLVYSGPGLPKRVNEAVLYESLRKEPDWIEPPFRKHWGWMVLMGLGMILGGVLAWVVAATSVLLTYDEAYLGLSAAELTSLLPRVKAFMSHDRISLAGTMISIGILYGFLGQYGLRAELHWAKTTLLTSGVVGFSSFFLYLGYGYFDPLHALSALLLLPLFLLAMRGGGTRPFRGRPELSNDRSWLLAQWGQLMFILLGAGFATGGLVIAWVGITGVFVPQDLDYLCTTASELSQVNGRLLPLIAHDRAGFGGALVSDALAVLGTALWGIRRGERWIWWMLLLAGAPGFAAGFGVHWSIGYTDFVHLLPAYFVAMLYVAGLILLYPYLMRSSRTDVHR
ncbi:hypothetical protein [Gorillibacterium sp. sgz5001074]|uniref:hypothetical protein n=1 Tax=Gorillibacterium sp. sgz5001074 TaxID=3446695 RepID=UPI003F678DE7